jgi:hypothetical protein
VAERVNAFGSHLDTVSQMKRRLRVFATRPARAVMGFAYDGVIALAIDTSLRGEFFQTIHADQALNENIY